MPGRVSTTDHDGGDACVRERIYSISKSLQAAKLPAFRMFGVGIAGWCLESECRDVRKCPPTSQVPLTYDTAYR